ncbi:MAG: hypothetical protein JXR49_08230 [Acidobacteria bacterium]|nr:hypothetical protein [Acidobacteriota bacterium]
MSRNCKTLEQNYNIPTVGGAASNIINYALNHDFKYTNGSPIRYISFPFPVAGQPQRVHHKYIFEGRDVVSGKSMMQAFIDALTVPLTDREKYKGPAPEPPPEESRFLGPDTEEKLRRLFKERDWTDYLPIVLPTEERVADMLKATSHDRNEVIKTLDWPGGKREVTVERVATCAVMAGAKPEYLPVILALANHVPFGNSTSSMANMILVNGPIRDEIGMNYGTNVMGPYNEANSVIGRTYTLMSKTIGGLHSEKTTWSSLGSTMQYNNVCIAENEEALPEEWEPFHVQMGYKPDDSVLSVGIGWSYISSVVMAVRDHPVQMIMGDYMKALTMGSATVIMDPTVAELLKDSLGFKTKDQLSKWFADNVEKVQYPSGEKIKPFNQSSVKIIVTGGGVQTTWFVTDFMLGPGMLGGSTLIDDWR